MVMVRVMLGQYHGVGNSVSDVRELLASTMAVVTRSDDGFSLVRSLTMVILKG